MVQPTDYGIVRFVQGVHVGQLGLYDDDDHDGRHEVAVVYLNTPGVPGATYVLARYGDLEPATREEKISFELEHLAQLPPEVRNRMGYHP